MIKNKIAKWISNYSKIPAANIDKYAMNSIIGPKVSPNKKKG